jgi:tRNA 2-thiouridine synthesizing protein A
LWHIKQQSQICFIASNSELKSAEIFMNNTALKTISEEQGGIDRELDLKGKVCPYTFIESMLALEEMETGQVLRVIVDYPPAVCDVPRSLRNEGYKILGVSVINDTDWAILVKNRPLE